MSSITSKRKDPGVIYEATVAARRWRIKRTYAGVNVQTPEIIPTREYERLMKLVEKFMRAGLRVEAEHTSFPVEPAKAWNGCPFDLFKVRVYR